MAMAEGESYREKPPALRVLFCFGVQPAFFEEPSARSGRSSTRSRRRSPTSPGASG
jgi:hypothetical protein